MKNKVVLITGASSGIGEATAKLLALEGYRVFLGARRQEKLVQIVEEINQNGGNAAYCKLDVTDKESFARFIQTAIDVFGRIDVLVNNAGIMLTSLIRDGKQDEWDRMIDINLKGVLNGVVAVLPVMHAQNSGMIINTTSTAAYRVQDGSAVYSATKFAVRAFSDGLRREESSHGIRVTTIAPGPTKTELTQHISDPNLKENLTKVVEDGGCHAIDIAKGIALAISMPSSASIDEMIISPTHKT